MRVRLDGEELRAQGRHFGGREAGGEEAVEALGCGLHARSGGAGAGAGGTIIFIVVIIIVCLVVTLRRALEEGAGGEGFGVEVGGRELRVRGYGAVDVEARGGFAGRGDAEGGVDWCVLGEERPGVDEAEGAGGKGRR